MKARLLFALIAAAAASQAWALSPTAAIDIQFFMAGATAQKNTIQNLLGGAAAEVVPPAPATGGFPFGAVPAICVAGTLDFFYNDAKGSNYRAYSCTLVAEAALPVSMQRKGLGGKSILIHYRLLGGSWIGVGPLSRAQFVTRMAVDATCTQPGTVGGTIITQPVPTPFPLKNLYNTPSYLCANTTTAIPDVGLSDQEPAIFYGANAPNDGVPLSPTDFPITNADLLNIKSSPLQGVIMNIIASKKLIQQMQMFQHTPHVTADGVKVEDIDRPNLTSPQITSLLTFNGGPYNIDWTPVIGDAGLNKIVHVCRRISAVGTQIAANSFWLNYPCAATSGPPPTGPVFPPNLAGITTQDGVYNDTYTITEANLIADMRACVAAYNNAATAADNYAIGLLFTDNNPSTENFAWDYLAIDGMSPSVANGVSGAYRFVTTETFQYRTRTVNNGISNVPPLTDPSPAKVSQFNLVTGLFSMLEDPRVLAVQPGFLALPDTPAFYVPGTNGNNIWKGSTQGPHACNPPILFY
jgi:hypothetical protein